MVRLSKENNLLAVNPKLAKQWHPTKNGILTPIGVTPSSGKKVWWKCIKGHEWPATINDRKKGRGCPFCSGKKVCKDNCLETINPVLAKEWHPKKNGLLTPKDVTPGSHEKVWWICKNEHIWEAKVYSRNFGSGCPYCSGRRACKDNFSGGKKVCKDNCLETINPVLAKEWHPTRNGSLTPNDVTFASGKKVWWVCDKGHEWPATINDRKNGSGCPFCSGKKVCKDNSLETINPVLAKEWHPTRNGSLTPNDVTFASGKKVWWVCENGHEWPATINDRKNGSGCPFCSGRKVCKDNCLDTVNPELAKEWHPTKNRSLTPSDVTIKSGKKVWWICKKGHEWLATVANRSNGSNCPRCNPMTSLLELRLLTELRSLFNTAVHREKKFGYECDIFLPSLNLGIEVDGRYWHKDKFEHDVEKTNSLRENGILLVHVREKGLKRISQTDIFFTQTDTDFEIIDRLLTQIKELVKLDQDFQRRLQSYSDKCELVNNDEYLSLLQVLPSPPPEKSLLSMNSRLAGEWHPTKNGSLTPRDVAPYSNMKVWWICNKGHAWEAVIANRNRGTGCPKCSKGQKRK